MRAYLCKGYRDIGEYGKALAECQSALRTVREVSPDNQYLITRIQLYLGSTLREMKRYDEAKKLLLEAQKGVKDEVLPELAEIARATGDQKSALAFYKKSLDEDSQAAAGESSRPRRRAHGVRREPDGARPARAGARAARGGAQSSSTTT